MIWTIQSVVLIIPISLVFVKGQIDNEETVREYLDNVRSVFDNFASRNGRFLLPPPPFYKDDSNYVDDGPLDENYDFIVVGSGSAGSVIANRLSEVPEWKVLLLEVGDVPSIITDLPVIAPAFQFTNYTWGYLAEKQDNVSLGLIDERMAWPRGRALGGTTIINYMIHVRGNKLDYDRWEAMGNPGWSYQDVLPYFLKSENSQLESQDENYHAQGGQLNVENIPYRTKAVHAFVKSAQEAGHPLVDYNGKTQIGVSYLQSTVKNGRRWSAEKAFLRPIRKRRNIRILTKSRVTKILIDPDTKVANGVEYIRNRKKYTVKANKEVILSAGAFNSPQLLMLSGVGPKEHLEELDIPVIKDLPVGQKLYDHLTFSGLAFTVNAPIVVNQTKVMSPESFFQFVLDGKGPLTSTGVEALAYIKTNVSADPEDYPDIELIFIGGGIHTDKGQIYGKPFRIKKEVYDAVFKPLEKRYAFMILPMLLHPKSTGYIKLKSNNPFQWPKFYGNYFTDPENLDIQTFIAGIREAQRIVRSPSFKKYNATVVPTKIPGCNSHEFDTDEYWECAVRHVSPTLHHQVATCKMGPEDDPEAVVDNRLRVYGVKNLRVADTGVIPLPLSAHTSIPAFMVGEKAADIIKQDWGARI